VTEEVVVVGTRGDARSPLDSIVPVDVITADDIAAAHSFGGNLGELLQALAPSFNFPASRTREQGTMYARRNCELNKCVSFA
jgi:hypothetical protein